MKERKPDKIIRLTVIALQLMTFLICDVCKGYSRLSGNDTIRMLFYNTENFFDAEDNPLKDDDEFLPSGARRWSNKRLESKINALYKVLVAAGNPEPPALAAFCEVEERELLLRLINDTWLKKYKYGIVYSESDDPRGIDIGLIYRKDVLDLISSTDLVPAGYSSTSFSTRKVLYTSFSAGSDTIHLFMNHWPSRRGGVLPGEDTRRRLTLMLRSITDSLCRVSRGNARIIIAGDFNCTPDDGTMQLLSEGGTGSSFDCLLSNLAEGLMRRGEGTFRYQGRWEMLDQVLVSENFLNGSGSLSCGTSSLAVFRQDFLLTDDPSYPGPMPFPTYRGYRYMGGFSDHLPLILDMTSGRSVR